MQHQFIEVIEADPAITGEIGMFWAVVEGAPGELPEIIDDAFYSVSEAETAGRAFQALMTTPDRESQHERATEAGCLHGVDAYNDAMGW